MQYMKGERVQLMRQAEREMTRFAKNKDFESAAKYRNQMRALQALSREVIFSDKEFLDLSKDHAITELMDVLGLTEVPRRIEGFDISHMQGTDTVASMVVFANGVPDKASYRKFKMRIPGNDDFAHMREVMVRRFSEKHAKDWPRPNLLLIDGGKGQLAAAVSALAEYGLRIPAVGLAKREEQIIVMNPVEKSASRGSEVTVDAGAVQRLGGFIDSSADFHAISLPHSTHVVKLLQRIRDESHRFAVSYHSVLKTKRQTASMLDDIPTIGPTTRKKLLRTFGSVKGIMQARDFELEKTVGAKKAAILKQYIRMEKKHLRP
jgi:excinuclease ABC subunit C